jgi:FHA domain
MTACPSGHDSASTDFCDVCGMRMDGAAAGPGPATASSAPPAAAGQDAPAGPDPAVAPAAGWTAVVTADRGYYDSVIAEGGPDASSIEFPQYCPERRFRLGGREMRIGRRSASRGLEPEIDLTGTPTDPGVSHLHAVLIAEPGGTWAVLDPVLSANGTTVNTGEIVPGVRVPLHDGDRICVGAWTVLTIQAPAATLPA